jgi:hypothetical protein
MSARARCSDTTSYRRSPAAGASARPTCARPRSPVAGLLRFLDTRFVEGWMDACCLHVLTLAVALNCAWCARLGGMMAMQMFRHKTQKKASDFVLSPRKDVSTTRAAHCYIVVYSIGHCSDVVDLRCVHLCSLFRRSTRRQSRRMRRRAGRLWHWRPARPRSGKLLRAARMVLCCI